jgi:murein DD-endopeptidase MepM/ murein hydrolase activator NlpD
VRARLFLGAGVVALAAGPVALAWAAPTHTVTRGETLSEIAARVRIPVSELAQANRIANPDRILAGEVLVLPGGGAGGGSAAGYVVKAGESLSGVASRLGVSQSELARANRIADRNDIKAGQVLVLPVSGGTADGRGGRSWVCPVKGGTFVNDYGYQRPDAPAPHQGVDLFAPRGTPVVAPVSGVLGRYPNDAGGLAFQLFGDDGVRYYGAHLEAYGAVGPVEAGTVIGYVGTTGDARATSPHLHFEAHPDGGAATANPYPTLVAACR